jgi:phosphoribosylglycinamide formyltransferase-1
MLFCATFLLDCWWRQQIKMSNVTKKRLKLGVLGSGKGSNLVAIAEAAQAGTIPVDIVLVIADSPTAGILERARSFGIPSRYIFPGNSKTRLEAQEEQNYIAALKEAGAEWIALAGFMRILKKGFLTAFLGKVVNIHPSLLPMFPGLHAWKQAIDSGVKITGVTVHYVDSGIDSGPVIAQRAVPVLDGDTPETLHQRIQLEEHKLYPATLKELALGEKAGSPYS